MANKTFIIPNKGKGPVGTVTASMLVEIGTAFPIFDSVGIISGDLVLNDTHHNKTIRITANSTITIPLSLRLDFDAIFESYPSQGIFVNATGVTLSAPFGKILKNNGECRLRAVALNDYRLNGGLSTF